MYDSIPQRVAKLDCTEDQRGRLTFDMSDAPGWLNDRLGDIIWREYPDDGSRANGTGWEGASRNARERGGRHAWYEHRWSGLSISKLLNLLQFLGWNVEHDSFAVSKGIKYHSYTLGKRK